MGWDPQHSISLVPLQFMLDVNRRLRLHRKANQTQGQKECRVHVLFLRRRGILHVWTAALKRRSFRREGWSHTSVGPVIRGSSPLVLEQGRLGRSVHGSVQRRFGFPHGCFLVRVVVSRESSRMGLVSWGVEGHARLLLRSRTGLSTGGR